ncbi:MAG TPA: hypothetical protein PLA68_10425 [Panacibacter sp.]|nr:hypothetical protein [Panacibacter sp.]
MKNIFRISKKIDAAYAGKVLFALEQSCGIQSVHITLLTGQVEIISDEPLTIGQVEELLADIKEIKVEEIVTNSSNP